MHVRGLAHVYRHEQERGKYPNIVVMRRNYFLRIHIVRSVSTINNDPIVRIVLFSSAPTFRTIFILGASLRRQESVLSNNMRRLPTLLHNVSILPSYVHHIL